MQPEGTRPPFFYVSPFLITDPELLPPGPLHAARPAVLPLPAAGDGGRPPGPRAGRGHGRPLHLRDAAGPGVGSVPHRWSLRRQLGRVRDGTAAPASRARRWRCSWPWTPSRPGSRRRPCRSATSSVGCAPTGATARWRSRCAGRCGCAASATSAGGSVAGESAAPRGPALRPRRGPPPLPGRRRVRRRSGAGPQRGLGRTQRQGLAPAVAGPHHRRARLRHGRRQPR